MSLNTEKFAGDKPTIVMLHGLGGTTRYWSSMLDFSATGREVVLVDLLGFGDSPKPYFRYTQDRHLHALIPVLSEIEDMVLVGHSLGALLSLAYATRFPNKVHKLVLLSLPLFDDMSVARTWFQHIPGGWVYTNYLAMMVACILTRRVAARFLPLLVRGYPKAVVQDLVKHNVMSSTTTLWNVIYNHDPLPDSLVPPKEMPVICIHSEDDDLAPYGNIELMALKQGWQLHTLNGTGHHPWLRKYQECWEIICGNE